MIDAARLAPLLLKTRLQQTNPPLYQFLSQLLISIADLNSNITSISGGGGSTTVLHSTTIMNFGEENDEEQLFVPSLSSSSSSSGLTDAQIAARILLGQDRASLAPTGVAGPQGPTGAQGIQGLVGPVILSDVDYSDDFGLLGIPSILLRPSQGGVGITTVLLTDGSTPALDSSLGSVFRLTAAGDRTIAVPSNPTPSQRIVIQHFASGGARTLSLNTGAGGFRFGSDITGLTQTVSGKTDYIGCNYNDTDSKWDVFAYVKGF